MMEDKGVINFSGGVKKGDKVEALSAKTTKIARDVISQLEKQDIPIFPDSFESVFEQIIADESEEFKHLVKQKEGIALSHKDRLLNFESEAKSGIKNVRDVLEITKEIYQSVVFAHNALKRKAEEISRIENPVAFKSAIGLCFQEFDNLQHTMETQIVEMKRAFEKIVVNIENVNKNAIYDTQYGVYNKKYFLSVCEKEKKILDQIGCSYAFVAYSLSKRFLESLKDKDFVRVSLKTMSKILSEHINNDEILCYFGSGKFVVLYKYIDSEKVLEKVKKISHLAKETNLFFEGEQTSLEFCSGVYVVNESSELIDEISYAISSCEEAFDHQADCEVYQQVASPSQEEVQSGEGE